MQLSGLLQLLLIGLIAASGPLAYAWARRHCGARKLAWIIVFFTFDLILFGAFTRLTDSGLGCPDWPGCYGSSNPLAAHADIRLAESAMPTGPVTVAKAWIEMIHRYLAMGVGVLLIALTALAWKQRRSAEVSPWGATGLLALVCVQGAFGAWTVTLKLMPLVVTVHLLLAILLLSALGWSAMQRVPGESPPQGLAALRVPIALVWGLLFVQIALGGWVSTNYAVLACPDFPLCHGALVPPKADFGSGFQLLRPLGVLQDGTHLPVEALVAIHWAHRAFALVVVAAVVWLGLAVRRAMAADDLSAKLARGLLALVVLQVLTGISNVVFAWPIVVAVLHNGGAAAMALLLALLHAQATASGAVTQASRTSDTMAVSA